MGPPTRLETNMALTWVEKGTLKGPQGVPGEKGADGARGYGYRSCNIQLNASASVPLTNITPSEGIQTGDTLVDSTGALWAVASVSDGSSVTVGASSIGSVRGPQGEQGAPGEKGEDGTGVNIKGAVDTSASLPGTGEEGDAYVVNDTGNLWVWDVDSSAFVDTGAQIKGPQGDPGPKGDPGAAATVTVGTTQTGEAGTEATVQNGGTTSAAVLNFVIPKGEKGDTGAAGPGVSVGSAAPSEPGQVGECYIDVTTGNLYRFEESGV